MDAIKCKFCGKREVDHVCEILIGKGKAKHREQSPAPGRNRADERAVGKLADKDRASPNNPDSAGLPGRFDRAAYQRDYMRKWRAKRTARLKELEALVKAKEMLE